VELDFYANADLARIYVNSGVGSATAHVWAQLYPVAITILAVYLGVVFMSPKWLLYPVFEEKLVRYTLPLVCRGGRC
jgi:hypothetical protein